MADTSRAAACAATKRPTRIPIGGHRNILTLPAGLRAKLEQQGLVPAFPLESECEAFERAGYVYINDDGTAGDRRTEAPSKMGSVVTATGKGGSKHVLMAQPREYWDEDRKREAAAVDATEETLRRPKSISASDGGQTVNVYGPGLTKE